jgi:hypothetical protein
MSSSPIESSPIESSAMTPVDFEGIMRDFSDHSKVTDADIMALKKLFTKYCSGESADTLSLGKVSPSIFPKCVIPDGYKLPSTTCRVKSKRTGLIKYFTALPGSPQDPVQFLECFKKFPSQFSDFDFAIAIAEMRIDLSGCKQIPEAAVQYRGAGSFKVITGPKFAVIITDNQFVQVFPTSADAAIDDDR